MGSLRGKVHDYFRSHKIPELLNHLSEMVFFFMPDDPVQFMAETVRRMKMAAEGNREPPALCAEESFHAYFRMLDPAGVGTISWDQLRSALRVLGFADVEVPDLKETPVFEDTFVELGMKCVRSRLEVCESPRAGDAASPAAGQAGVGRPFFSEADLISRRRPVADLPERSHSVEETAKSAADSLMHDAGETSSAGPREREESRSGERDASRPASPAEETRPIEIQSRPSTSESEDGMQLDLPIPTLFAVGRALSSVAVGDSSGEASDLPEDVVGDSSGEASDLPEDAVGDSSGEASDLPEDAVGDSSGEASDLPEDAVGDSSGEASVLPKDAVDGARTSTSEAGSADGSVGKDSVVTETLEVRDSEPIGRIFRLWREKTRKRVLGTTDSAQE